MYPKSIYKDGSHHVAWGPEEHAARKADGWSDHKPAIAAAAADPESTSTDDTASTISTTEPEAPQPPVVPQPESRPALQINPLPEKVARAVAASRTRKA